jgi:hypothetical protein
MRQDSNYQLDTTKLGRKRGKSNNNKKTAGTVYVALLKINFLKESPDDDLFMCKPKLLL